MKILIVLNNRKITFSVMSFLSLYLHLFWEKHDCHGSVPPLPQHRIFQLQKALNNKSQLAHQIVFKAPVARSPSLLTTTITLLSNATHSEKYFTKKSKDFFAIRTQNLPKYLNLGPLRLKVTGSNPSTAKSFKLFCNVTKH